MAAPYFYNDQIDSRTREITLSEDTSRHITQVLRMQPGEIILLTNGKGWKVEAHILTAHKKATLVKCAAAVHEEKSQNEITIAISLIKNVNRFEWFLEKATEIGVSHIIPLICNRTEKQHFRFERMNSILVSAMLQSQQTWLPVLSNPVQFKDFVVTTTLATRLIAHCEPGEKKSISGIQAPNGQLICIGPEGDFSPDEINLALKNEFLPVHLGNNRLRTETAGVVAATLMANA